MLSRKTLIIGPTVLALVLVSGVFVFRPDWIIGGLAKRSPKVVYFAETEEPVVALTIDDGPDPVTTSTLPPTRE